MTLRKFLTIIFSLLILLVVTVALISIDHPIIVKWVTGSAVHFGRPITATVYTNGQVNNRVKVFYTDEPNNYLVSFTAYTTSGIPKFLNINVSEKWIGTSATMCEKDYDLIAGHLFLSKSSTRFSPLQPTPEHTDFKPQISFAYNELKFNMPSNKLDIDSVRIQLYQ